MTEKLYDLDSKLLRFRSEVLACEKAERNKRSGYAVLLSKTCFFPEGGGQPADTGTLDGIPVFDTYEEEGQIFHLCSEALEPGKTVLGEVAPTRRLQHMQTHSGEHILSGLILREFGLKNIGFHMGKDCNTIDLDGSLTAADCERIEDEVNAAIWANHAVKVSYPAAASLQSLPLRKKPEVAHLRVVEISGCDCCGCCGTHVSSTGEIGLLKLIDAQPYKGGTRLSFLCGAAAFADYRAKHKAARGISASLSCKALESEEAVAHLLQEAAALKAQLAHKNQALFALLGEKLLQEAPVLGGNRWVFFWNPDFSAEELKSLALLLSKESHLVCTAFSGGKDGLRYALSQSADCSLPLNTLCQMLKQKLGGKGGGGKNLCCGKADSSCSTAELKQLIQTIL